MHSCTFGVSSRRKGGVMTRRVVMMVAVWCVTAVGLAGAPEAITVTGCVTQAADSGLLLRPQPSDSTTARRASAGSNTSKGSTPIGGAPLMVADRPSAGSTTPKGSTPISRGAVWPIPTDPPARTRPRVRRPSGTARPLRPPTNWMRTLRRWRPTSATPWPSPARRVSPPARPS